MHHHHAGGRRHQHQPTANRDWACRLHLARRRGNRSCAPRMIAHGDHRDRRNRRVAREGSIVQRQDDRARKLCNSFDQRFKDHLCFGARHRIPNPQGWLEDGEHDETAYNRENGHIKRWHQAMPNLEICFWDLGRVTQDGGGDKFHKRFGQERRNTDHDHQHNKDRWRQPKTCTRIMRFGRVVVAHRAEEDVTNQTEAVGCRKQ